MTADAPVPATPAPAGASGALPPRTIDGDAPPRRRRHERRRSLLRRIAIVAALALAWQVYAVWLDNPLLLPTLTQTGAAWWHDVLSGELPRRTANSVAVLALGYAIGLACAAALTVCAISSRLGADLLSNLTAMLNPLPGIALLPLAMLWFGIGVPSMLFVLVHSVLWPVSLNSYAGLSSVPATLRMVGANYGLRGPRLVVRILVPSALPSILAGLRAGWSYAWRTLVAAELVFGVSSGGGGLGWYILEHRDQLETADVFAGLLTVVAIGLTMENLVFRNIEARTVRRWGMQQ